MLDLVVSAMIRYTLAVLTTGALLTAGLMVYAAEPWRSNQSFSLGYIVFIAWAVTPYIAGGLVARYYCRYRRSMIILLIGFTVSVGAAVFVYYDSMFVHIDAQGALIFLFFPAYQLALTLLLAFVAAILKSLEKHN